MFLNDLIKKTPGLSTLFNSSLQMLSSVNKDPSGKQTQQLVSTNAKAAGLVLLVLLFSFGLFFNPSQVQQQQQQQQPFVLPWSSTQLQVLSLITSQLFRTWES
jgi:Tfp pilus assembly protein PilN